MPYTNLPESEWGKMDSCVTDAMKKDPSLSKESAIKICYNSITKEFAMTKNRQERKERQRAKQAALSSKEAGDGLPPEMLMVEEQQPEPEQPGEKNGMEPMAMPMLGGATSWDELDSYMAAEETSEALSDLNMHFQCLVQNVLASPDVEDKAGAISDLATGLKKRLNNPAPMKEAAEKAITKSEADGNHPASHYLVVEDPEKPTTWHLMVKDMQGKPDSRLMGAAHAALMSPGGHRGNKYEGPGKTEAIAKLKAMYKSMDMTWPEDKKSISDRLADWLGEKAQEIVSALEGPLESIDAPATLTALKSTDGKPMLMLHTTNAFKDRDGEIFMDKALREYAEKAEPGTPVDYWHTKWTPGRVTWTAYSEKALFELVEAEGDKASQELFALIEKDPAYWGCSHRFFYRPKERASGVFSELNKTRSTLLPLSAAANPYTAVGALTKEVDMVDAKKLEELKGKMTPEAYALAEGFIKSEEQKSAALVEAGVEHKEAKPQAIINPATVEEITALKQLVEGLQAQNKTLVARLDAAEEREKTAQAAREKASLAPRGADFFSSIPASRDLKTALGPDAFKNVGPGEKAVTDPMIESLKVMGLVTQNQ